MDPLSLAIGVVGLGTSIFGGLGASSQAKQAAQISSQISGIEQQENGVRQQMMEISGRRSQMETLRNAQRARAMGVNAAVNQGAQFGSGIAGGTAETTSEANYGMLGINQNLAVGRQMFGYDNQISGLRQQLAQVQGQQATDQGIASLGGAVMKSAPMLGAFGSSVKGMFQNGSNPFNVTGNLY